MAAPWQDPVIRAILGGGFTLTSLSFAAFTFLYGALLSLRNDDWKDPRIRTYKQKLASAIYGTATAVGSATVVMMLAIFSLVTSSKTAAICTVCLALMIMLGLSAIAWNLAFDLFRARAKLQKS